MKKSVPIALSCLFAALIMPPALHAALRQAKFPATEMV